MGMSRAYHQKADYAVAHRRNADGTFTMLNGSEHLLGMARSLSREHQWHFARMWCETQGFDGFRLAYGKVPRDGKHVFISETVQEVEKV